ncbi:MAG: VWA domain-containing protein [Kofleriaceae bacterium]
MTFRYPELVAVAALALVVVLGLGALDELRRRSLMRKLGHVPQLRRLLVSTSTWRRWLKRCLLAVGVALLAVAAARPQRPGERDEGQEGLDVVVGLDVSKSMLVADVGTDRLGRARAMLDELLPRLINDRVGAMVFAGTAAHFPLSDDKAVALQFLHDLGPADLPGGSAVAEAFRVATCVLRPETRDAWGSQCSDVRGRGHGGDPVAGEPQDTPVAVEVEEVSDRSKVFLLITDGDDPELVAGGEVAAQVSAAKQHGITLLVVGVGTAAGGRVPAIDDRGRPNGRWTLAPGGQPAESRLDAELLTALAEAGGDRARYFELGAGAFDVAPIERALDALSRGALARRHQRVMDEWFAVFLFPGFMLLVIEACIGTRRRVRYPEGDA